MKKNMIQTKTWSRYQWIHATQMNGKVYVTTVHQTLVFQTKFLSIVKQVHNES